MGNVFFYHFPVGKVGIAESDGAICGVFFDREKAKAPAGFVKTETALIKKAAAQLTEYFAGKRQRFDIPLSLLGTAFQVSVWKALQTIPYGKTCCYGDIAAKIGKPKAVRAVGMANNRNPVSIIVPCHRVIGKDGSLTGYGGGLPAKQLLLDLEQPHAKS